MSEEIVVKPVDAIELLNPEEKKAYRLYLAKGDPPLSPKVQAELFSLFLNGSTCEEIVKLNPNFNLGMVVRARVDGQWDLRADEYRDHLFAVVKDRVMQAQMESVLMTADLLTAANIVEREKIKKFIQTRDPRELGSLKIDSIKQYRDVVDLLLKLTGQDKKIEVKGEQKTTVEFKGKLNPKEAAALLKLADSNE